MQLHLKTKKMQDGTLRIEANHEIVPGFRGSFQRGIQPSHRDIVKLGELGVFIIEQIFFYCEGVVNIKIHSPYGFVIEKGMLFTWNDIIPELNDTLRYCLHYGPPSQRPWKVPYALESKPSQSNTEIRKRDTNES